MASDRWLVALDIDGTVLHEDGTLSDAVLEQVRSAADRGHEVMLASFILALLLALSSFFMQI